MAGSKLSAGYRKYLSYEPIIKEICYGCGAPSLKRDFVFFRKIMWSAGDCFTFVYGQTHFVLGVVGKDHLRIYGLAVKEAAHRRGYGRKMMNDVLRYARSLRKHRITLRANIAEKADVYYATQFGFVRDLIKDTDYEMHKELTYANE